MPEDSIDNNIQTIQLHITGLITFDLKLDKFKAEYKVQKELYLRWLEKPEMLEGENSPVGLILCADAKKNILN